MAGTVNVTLARANGAGPGLIPSKSGIKAHRLYPMGIGPTPKRYKANLPHNCWGSCRPKPAVSTLSELQ